MNKLFDYHIEYKSLTPELTGRIILLYIENFDPERIYLYRHEIAKYYALEEQELNTISNRMKNQNFSDFTELDQIFKNAVLRSRKLRAFIEKDLILKEPDLKDHEDFKNYEYALNDKDLQKNLKSYLIKYLAFQKKRASVHNQERRIKAFALFERQIRSNEDCYFSNEKFSVRFLKAFAKSLDAHTSFFSEEEAYEMRMTLEKRFEGVGVVLSEGIDGIQIVDLISNSPAEKSKRVQENDLLIEINGKNIENLPFQDVLKKMKDQKEIILGLKRPSGKEYTSIFQVRLKKKPISLDEERLQYGSEKTDTGLIGILTLKAFYENDQGVTAENDIKHAIDQLKRNANLEGIILDLRENSGGFLSQAVKIAGLFIKSGIVVVAKYTKGETLYFRAMGKEPYYSGPLIVLTSKYSASASEIVAQALQDYGVALIVGDERTFGKGSIQYQTVTNENAGIYFKVTVGKYYTPSGKSTQIDGVLSDIYVPSRFYDLQVGERYLKYPLPKDRIAPVYKDPLKDLDVFSRFWFEKNYLPNLQKKVSVWQEMAAELQANSSKRYQSYPSDFYDDLQKHEAIQIMKEMIQRSSFEEAS